MLPPRYWPTALWVASAVAALLFLHAVGLAVHLAVAGPDAPSYEAHVLGGFAPGLIFLGLGVFVSIPVLRDTHDAISGWGRVFVLGFIVIALVLLWLGLQVY